MFYKMRNAHFYFHYEIPRSLITAVRKAKFFLHPDKLPKDLTDNQTLLFKTMWEVLTEREAATLGQGTSLIILTACRVHDEIDEILQTCT